MRKNIVKDKSFEFSVRVVKLYQHLCTQKKEFVLSKQLLRSGTSVGAMVREAEHAETKKDFIHKMAIAQKETVSDPESDKKLRKNLTNKLNSIKSTKENMLGKLESKKLEKRMEKILNPHK